MADDAGSFEVNGKRYSLATNLTMGEMCDAEQFFGVSFGDPAATMSIRMVAALMYLSIRREDASVSVEDIRGLPADVFETWLAEGTDVVPPAVENVGDSEPSGLPSGNGGASQDDHHASIGSPGLAIGSDSDLVTSPT